MSNPTLHPTLFLQQFQATVAVMADSLDGADLEHLVEVGSTLAAAIAQANNLLGEIKEQLRDRALIDLQHAPGVQIYQGLSSEGEATIINPEPSLHLLKDADPLVLRRELGEDFDLYFETKTTYKPKKAAEERVVKLASGKQKTILLTSMQSVGGTPRVSFKKR